MTRKPAGFLVGFPTGLPNGFPIRKPVGKPVVAYPRRGFGVQDFLQVCLWPYALPPA